MPETPNKFYLTTPIYYVNARPHIGHAYTTIVADVIARRSRAQGADTWFLTGTDEHGQKIERSAASAGIPPQQFADQISKQFQDLWDRMGLTYNQFIRTTDEAHKRGVQKLFTTLQQNGHIYLSSYTGAYCVSDETFVDVPTGTPCPDCGRPTETVTEENYFFRLSDFQLPVLNLIESNTLVIEPDSRRNEVLSFLRGPTTNPGAPHLDSEMWEGSPQLPRTAAGTPYLPGSLRDLSISRSSFTWGIPVPSQDHGILSEAKDPCILPVPPQAPKKDHVIYVWLDALANYMTAVGYGDDSPEAQARFAKYWPADLHIVGKEIIRFHCVYWPAFLLALNPAPTPGAPHLASEMWDSEHKSWVQTWLPKKIVAHGWLLFDDAKMSKSKGNIVRTETILEAFGTLCPPPPIPSPDAAVILSEAASQAHRDAAQSKNPEGSDPATTAQPFPPHTPASAPPQPTPHHRDLFAADVLRYFLLREIPFGQDGSFSFEALNTRYNADLANGYGNLVSRTFKMISNYFNDVVPESTPETIEKVVKLVNLQATFAWKEGFVAPLLRDLDEHRLDRYLQGVQGFISVTNETISLMAPWKERATPEQTLRNRQYCLVYSWQMIRIITALLHPILPYATANVWRQLGLGDIEQAAANGDLKNLQWGGLQPGTRLGPLSSIFPRADKGLAQLMANLESLPPITTQQDATTPLQSEFAEAPIASATTWTKSVPSSVESVVGLAPEPATTTDPAAGPRTATFSEPDPGLQVAGSTAASTERPGTPPHTEAASGIFNNETRAPFIAEPHPGMSGSTPEPSSPSDSSPQITIEDFAKIELRVAQIVLAERIPKADKLLRLEVDLGYERRQILSGIAEWYTPEDLLGRRIVVITNLAPRKMRGLESHGMLLAASGPEGGKPHLATIDSPDLPLGSRLK